MVEPVLFCAFFFVTGLTLTFVRPTNVEESFLHPTSFQYQFSGHVSMSFSPPFLRLLAQQGQSRLQPNSLLHFFFFMLCCPLLPVDSPVLLQKTFSSHLHGKHISCQFFCRLRISRCVSHITAPAGPLLCPHLNFSNLLHSRFFLFMMPIFPSILLLPSTEWPRWKAPPPLRGHMLP